MSLYYGNLKFEMRRKRIFQRDIANLLKQNEIAVAQKINASKSFTLEEAELIRSRLFPETEMRYLFEVRKQYRFQQGRSESQK
jgi:hypothetical protein